MSNKRLNKGEPATARPNVLFITCHDLGRHISPYGQENVMTPVLGRLAAQGVLFENAFCTAPQCSPSRAALHTGRYAHAVGVLGLTHGDFGWDLNGGEKHLAAHLREAGYETALFGIQHVTTRPERLGYDAVFPTLRADHMAAAAREYLTSRNPEKPFYLEVGFFEPHRPYDWQGTKPDTSQGVTLPPYLPDVPEAEADVAALQGAVRMLNTGVGILLDSLDDLGLAENTWVVFTTDHGLAMPRAKCTLYDPGIEAALLMRWPGGGVAGGKRYTELVSHVDMVPTVLERLNFPLPNSLHGRSYASLLRGGDYTPRDALYAEKTFHEIYDPMRAVRTLTHKLIVNFETGVKLDVPGDVQRGPLYRAMLPSILQTERPGVELYDLEQDPNEGNNLAGREEVGGSSTPSQKNLPPGCATRMIRSYTVPFPHPITGTRWTC